MDGERRATSLPDWPRGPLALFALLAALLVLAAALLGQSEALEFRAYLLLLVAGPFAAALLEAGLERRLGPAAWQQAAGRMLLFAAALLALLALAGLLRQLTGLPLLREALIGLLAAFLGLASLGLAGRLPRGLTRRLDGLERATVPLLLGALAVFCAVYAPLYPGHPLVSAVVQWSLERPLFPVLLLLAWPLAWLLPRLPAARGGLAAGALLAAALVFALLLFDDGLFRAYDHYVPYVGPALHQRHGGVPMVEAYSQYGLLPFVVLAELYDWLPQTFGTAAVVVRLFTLAWFAIFLLIVFRLVHNRAAGMLLGGIGLLWAITFPENLFNLNGLPSTQGYRYLLPTLAVLALAWTSRSLWRSGILGLVAGLASLWSLEALLFAVGPVLALAFLDALCRRSPRRFLLDGGVLLVGIAAAQGTLAACLFSVYGELPDYRPYFELTSNFRPGGDSFWSVPIPPEYGLWVPMAAAFFVPIALAGRDALAGEINHTRAWSLVPAAVFGIGSLSYFVGRSSTTTPGLALLPFLIVAITGFDALLDRWRTSRSSLLAVERALVGLAIAAVFAFTLERFARPYAVDHGNATLLRSCFAARGCNPGDVAARIAEGMHETVAEIDETDPVHFEMAGSGLGERLRELEGLVGQHFGNEQRIAALIDTRRLYFLGVALFAGDERWYRWPVSSSLNDMESSLRRTAFLRTAAGLEEGTRLLVDRDREALLPVWRDVWDAIEDRCALAPIGGGSQYAVLELRDCGSGRDEEDARRDR